MRASGTALADYHGTALSLRALEPAEIVRRFGQDRLELIMRTSHGVDASAVREAPPLSVRVSSWTAHTLLSDLCRATP